MISQTVHFYLSAVGSRRRAMTRHHYGRLSFTGGNLGKKGSGTEVSAATCAIVVWMW